MVDELLITVVDKVEKYYDTTITAAGQNRKVLHFVLIIVMSKNS